MIGSVLIFGSFLSYQLGHFV